MMSPKLIGWRELRTPILALLSAIVSDRVVGPRNVRQCAGATVMNRVIARAARCVSQTQPDPTTASRLVAHTVRRRHSECRLQLRATWESRSIRSDELGRLLDEPELHQGCDAVIKADFLDDLAVLELQHGRSGELHLATGVSRQ